MKKILLFLPFVSYLVKDRNRLLAERDILKLEISRLDHRISLRQKPGLKKWQKIINVCQQEIRNNHPHPVLAKKYHLREIFYWQNLIRWLYHFRYLKIKNCLEIGCGYGTISLFCHRLFDCRNYCTDIYSKYFPHFLVPKYQFHFKIHNIETDQSPFRQKFDLIILTEVIEHFNFTLVPTLQKIIKNLSPRGIILVSTPDRRSWGFQKKYYRHYYQLPSSNLKSKTKRQLIDDHVWHFDLPQLKKIFQESGLKIIKFKRSPGIGKKHLNFILSLQKQHGWS